MMKNREKSLIIDDLIFSGFGIALISFLFWYLT